MMKIARILILMCVTILIILRLMLPHYLLRYAVDRINQIPDYKVKIADLDVALIAGSYTLKNIQLFKTSAKLPVPFFAASELNFSIQWTALFHGKLVGKVSSEHPVLNFVVDPQGKNEQLSISSQWEDAVKALFPLNFNSVDVHDGEINFRSYTAKPPFKLTLKNIRLQIDNMRNEANTKELLPATFSASGESSGGADVYVKGKFNPLSKAPTFYITSDLKHMPISEAGNLLKHYTAADVKGGSFSLYVEVAAAKGRITGYAKPFIKDLKIAPERAKNPIEAIYDGALIVISKIVTNSKQQTIATKINLSGDIEDPNTSILSILGYVLSHAFIQALIPSVDHDVKMQDVYYGHTSKHQR
jgi:uncharacterized protein YhdP